MSVKKNLTLATLAALLAVPAFGITNNASASSIPPLQYRMSHAHLTYRNPRTTAGDKYSLNYGGYNYTMNSLGRIVGRTPLNNSNSYSNSNNNSNGDNQEDSSYNNNQSNSSNDGNSTQYASKTELPQTSENNGSKAAILGAATFTTLGLAALAMSKKHKNMAFEDLSTTDAIDNSNDKPNNDKSNVDESSYNMIMSNTFANISNDLKNY